MATLLNSSATATAGTVATAHRRISVFLMVQFTAKNNLSPWLLIFLLPQSTITPDAKKWKKDHLA